ncbi:MAG: AB hydrolase superfamily protein YvaM [Chroococcopsis gigantea SAG 12.99]|jgi:pimeloyl-ACP methyl ester carboxylesterase|nr:alpha/beta hydrolase [Chlorogloea purpurea SAG 13.99]MDV3000360.1 AB hydrolase superfamily protein YvaM [Chroococcopsis gigantea SAG 12.99]
MTEPIPLHVDIKGRGFPILCLHGHPGSARSMSVFTDHLSSRFRTFAPDLRGYGKSTYKGRFEMEDHIKDLTNLLDTYELNKCLLLGWSLGGILALELILSDPQRFQGMILIASAARPLGNHPPVTNSDLLLTAMAGIINFFAPANSWNIEILGKRSLLRYLFGQHNQSAYTYLHQHGTPAYLKTFPNANAALSRALSKGYDRLAVLDRITVPCLVMAGQDDRHITSYSSQETAGRLPQCQWICYPDTAHLFPWEIPSQVLKDLDAWLDSSFTGLHDH